MMLGILTGAAASTALDEMTSPAPSASANTFIHPNPRFRRSLFVEKAGTVVLRQRGYGVLSGS
jgi:hypothetical protein